MSPPTHHNPDHGKVTASPDAFGRFPEANEPTTPMEAMRAMVHEQRETNKRLAKIETELLGREGDRGSGLVFRLAAVESSVAAYRKISWMLAGTVVALLVTRVAQLLGSIPG